MLVPSPACATMGGRATPLRGHATARPAGHSVAKVEYITDTPCRGSAPPGSSLGVQGGKEQELPKAIWVTPIQVCPGQYGDIWAHYGAIWYQYGAIWSGGLGVCMVPVWSYRVSAWRHMVPGSMELCGPCTEPYSAGQYGSESPTPCVPSLPSRDLRAPVQPALPLPPQHYLPPHQRDVLLRPGQDRVPLRGW